MALRPDSANGHYLKGRIERFRGSCQTAARHLARALAIDPNHPGALSFLVAAYALQMGKPSAAEDLAKRLIAIDPLSPLTGLIIGWHEWLSGRTDEALSTFERVLELEPDFVFAHVQGTAYVLMWQDRREEARDVLTPIARRDPRDFFADWAILLQCALAGDSAGAERALSENSRAYFWYDPEAPWFMASAYALAGAKEEALRWLERAVDRGWINYPLFSHQDPLLESIRGEERFQNLMHKVEAAWNAFEVPLVQG